MEDEWTLAKVVSPDGSKEYVDADKQKNLNLLKDYVNKTCRITLIDGRVVSGLLICFDYQGNVLVNNASEESTKMSSSGSETKETRSLGMIMVKPQHLVKFEVGQLSDSPSLF
uniref:Sm domain-containing protein n=1 Tax=Guillardia theta TaxID=55529 RepID=A0A7S4PFU0_GUITH|mmetsp:Transcript_49831/g.155942  ORF Transcript_49831/g.155942 Transcript_49831/m.155942 type:complete len:113 (+) Transcript_49831:225-563(+)